MSHIATIAFQFKDFKVLEDLCKKLKIEYKSGVHTARFYEGDKKGIFSFTPPGWRYPVMVQEDGKLICDTFNGSWGKMEEFDKIRNSYIKELTIKNMKKKGYYLSKTVDENGEVELTFMR